jgi:hypothetical protein
MISVSIDEGPVFYLLNFAPIETDTSIFGLFVTPNIFPTPIVSH